MNPEIAGGIAASAVSFLLANLEAFAKAEWNLKENIKKEVRDLEAELQSIQAHLKDVDSKTDHNNQLKDWIKNVRDQAYDIEDVLDQFRLNKESGQWRRYIKHHSINNLMQDIKNRLCNIEQTRKRYNSMPSTSTNARSNTDLHVPVASLFIADVDIVGIEETRNELVS